MEKASATTTQLIRPRREVITPILTIGLHGAIVFAAGRWLFSLADSSFTDWINWSDYYSWLAGDLYLNIIIFGYFTCMLHITVGFHFYYSYYEKGWLKKPVVLRLPLSLLSGAVLSIYFVAMGIVLIIVGWIITAILVLGVGPFVTIGWEYLARCLFHLATDSPVAAWGLLGGLIGGIFGSYMGLNRIYTNLVVRRTKLWTCSWISSCLIFAAVGIYFWQE